MLFTAAGKNTPKGTQILRTCFASKNSYKLLKTSPCGVCELHGKVMYMADSKALRGKSLWFRSRKGIKNNLDFVKFQFILKRDKRFKQITISRLCCTSLYNVEVSGSYIMLITFGTHPSEWVKKNAVTGFLRQLARLR